MSQNHPVQQHIGQNIKQSFDEPQELLLHREHHDQLIQLGQIGGFHHQRYEGFGSYHNFGGDNQHGLLYHHLGQKGLEQQNNLQYDNQIKNNQSRHRISSNAQSNYSKQHEANHQNSIQQVQKPPLLKRKCICKKTQCLKMYCQCFASNMPCNQECVCLACKNTLEHQKQIFQAKLMIREKGIVGLHSCGLSEKRCNCKKSNCLKKYCECYNSGVKCSSGCKCKECKNCDNVKNQEVVEIKKKIKKVKDVIQKLV